jgi:hypothetical protein
VLRRLLGRHGGESEKFMWLVGSGNNGMAGSQKRAINEPEGRDESRFALLSKK